MYEDKHRKLGSIGLGRSALAYDISVQIKPLGVVGSGSGMLGFLCTLALEKDLRGLMRGLEFP
jgi:hypothetical protein